MKVIKIILSIIAAIFLIVGIPIIINECYKANCGYITVPKFFKDSHTASSS